MVTRSMLEDYVEWVDCQYWHITKKDLNVLPHCHGQYECILTLTDNIVHRINGVNQILPENTLIFIRPDDIHEFRLSPADKQEFICLSYTKDVLEKFFAYMNGTGFPVNRLLLSPMPPMCRISRYEKERLFLAIEDIKFSAAEDKDVINTRFRFLLTDLFRHFYTDDIISNSSDSLPLWLETTCRKMRLRENFYIGLPKMIELSGKSKEHLSRSMKKYLHITPAEYINDLRLKFAANRLITTPDSILDICLDAGFGSTVYFHKKFKEKFHETPLNFRKKSI